MHEQKDLRIFKTSCQSLKKLRKRKWLQTGSKAISSTTKKKKKKSKKGSKRNKRNWKVMLRYSSVIKLTHCGMMSIKIISMMKIWEINWLICCRINMTTSKSPVSVRYPSTSRNLIKTFSSSSKRATIPLTRSEPESARGRMELSTWC